ncbi:MAG: phage portal protein [Deltaproteobacteria bacterium]|jgi:hypothetical protein|nr:phage portal protein [Deltaproteobacteria bacterium]
MPDTHNFEQEHPLYKKMLPTYRRNHDLYEGGTAIERTSGGESDKKNKYLTRHPLEKGAQYAIRVQRAAYRNYAAPTVDLFASSVTDGVERAGVEEIARLKPLLTDCDRQGGTPDSFFKGVLTQAAAVAVEFVLVDMPQAEAPANTEAEAQRAGLQPYFVRVPFDNVIAWDFDPDGSLAWAVQRDIQTESKGPFQGYEEVKTITLWRKDGWERYVSRGGSTFEPAGGGAYNLGGRVPLVPFIYERETSMTGRSVIDDVASLIIRVFNQDSEMDKMLFDAAVPLLCAFGLDEEVDEALQRASSNMWRFSNADAKIQYVETSGTSYAAKRQQILDDIDSIREISLRQTKPKGAAVESAESKRLDTVQISSQLADFARSCGAAEKLCWELAGLYVGEAPAALDKVEIKYNSAFDPQAMREKLTEAYMEMRRNGDISRETLWKQVGMTDDQIEQEKVLLEDEQRQAGGMTGPGGTGLQGAVQSLLNGRNLGA